MITRLAVKNYRSLKDSVLSFGSLTILIGPNGSGKSNVLDVLRLVRELTVQGVSLPNALAPRGGYAESIWGGETEREIEIELAWRAASPQEAPLHHYTANLSYTDSGDAIFNREELSAPTGEALKRTSTHQFTFQHDSETVESGSTQAVSSAVYGAGTDKWPSPSMLGSMRDWAFYHFRPDQMRSPQRVRSEYRLEENGQNLSTVVHTLFSDDDPVLAEIVDLVRACVPTVEELRSPIFGDAQTYVSLKEKSVPKPVGSWGLSDGTLLVLALATALMAPKPPTLLAQEAPDTELHPHVMETLADMLKLAAKKTQVIATTHSPYLLDFLPRESFVVVEKEKGATRCKALKGQRVFRKCWRSWVQDGRGTRGISAVFRDVGDIC